MSEVTKILYRKNYPAIDAASPEQSQAGRKASRIAKELEAAGNGHTKVLGYQYEIADEVSVNALWDNLARDGLQIDILILNAVQNVPNAQECAYHSRFQL
jgi:short-subunit dehydrogenase